MFLFLKNSKVFLPALFCHKRWQVMMSNEFFRFEKIFWKYALFMGNFILNLGIFMKVFGDFQTKFWKNFLLNLGSFSWNLKKNSGISENFFEVSQWRKIWYTCQSFDVNQEDYLARYQFTHHLLIPTVMDDHFHNFLITKKRRTNEEEREEKEERWESRERRIWNKAWKIENYRFKNFLIHQNSFLKSILIPINIYHYLLPTIQLDSKSWQFPIHSFFLSLFFFLSLYFSFIFPLSPFLFHSFILFLPFPLTSILH